MSNPSRSASILIVDDDPLYGMLAVEALNHAGFRAEVLQTGAALRESFARIQPDLVLLDVELPDANGIDMCAWLRSAGATDIPIVMVTGHDDTHSITRAYEAGATDFINKPILWGTLPHRVEFLLRAHANLRALRASEQKNRALLQALPDTLLIVDDQGIIQEYITGEDGASRANYVGKALPVLIPPQTVPTAMERLRAAIATGQPQRLEFDVGTDEDHRAYEARMRAQSDGQVLIVLRDATERRRTEARIQYLAYYDTLTGLPNRQLFVRELRRAIRLAERTSTRLALLYLDLDRFKRINDNLGHSVGDALLQSVARRLESGVRPTEVAGTGSHPVRPHVQHSRIARLGGDEFVILLSGVTDEQQAAIVANRVRIVLSETFNCNGHRFVVTPSIGIAMYPDDGRDIEDLLVKADLAMYRAKEQGRNGHAFYGESMSVRSLGRLELEDELRVAIEKNRFELYYQPKLDLTSNRIIGAEALLRWSHPTRGWIPPDTFIPIAEETGMIVGLGEWVIREACRQLRSWNDAGIRDLVVSVNVATQQFEREDFVDSVLRTVWKYGIRPDQLEIEITESALMRRVEETIADLQRLRDAGIVLSIDDFGTGYSSLGYLKQFPVNTLKIDRSFVKDLHTSGDDAAICAAIIAMARELRLKVVAEGVEVNEQLEFLRRQGCDHAQGYLIGKPVPIDQIEEFFRQRRPPPGAPANSGSQR
ncbi:MAG: EAL domain-containing protein [Steroidobacteraceae bacterium]